MNVVTDALVVIGTDCIGSCKSSYHTITTATVPRRIYTYNIKRHYIPCKTVTVNKTHLPVKSYISFETQRKKRHSMSWWNKMPWSEMRHAQKYDVILFKCLKTSFVDIINKHQKKAQTNIESSTVMYIDWKWKITALDKSPLTSWQCNRCSSRCRKCT
jgi:hypothetical protein